MMASLFSASLLAFSPPTSRGAPTIAAQVATPLVGRLQSPRCCDSPSNPEDVAKKYGLEAGLFSALRNKGGGGDGDGDGKKGSMATAGDLLKRYGGAYLLTSTSLAIVSFSLCYLLIDNGVDMQSLLANIGIQVEGSSETASTAAFAYVIHKALSPVRFPPTVALTPVVAARVFGKTDVEEEPAEEAAETEG